MESIFTLSFVLIYTLAISQDGTSTDSVNVRILNKGKYYIKEYTLTIDGKDYKYTDVWKKKYSDYQRMPYIWPINRSKTVVIIKQMIRYDKWMNVSSIPIDHVGEKKRVKGYYTIEVRTKRNKGSLKVEEVLKDEMNKPH